MRGLLYPLKADHAFRFMFSITSSIVYMALFQGLSPSVAMGDPCPGFAILTVLLLSISVTSSSLGVPLHNAAQPRCWYPLVTQEPLVFRECNDIITQQITQTPGKDPDVPLIFSRYSMERPDIRLPYT